MASVLIVEDDTAMAAALKDGFEYEGYHVNLASDGAAGLALAKRSNPDLIILDVMLPQMNGLDVCRQLRDEGSRLPIIMLTARSEEVDKVRGLRLGADDYITKPFSLMELLARVEAVLRRSAQKRSAQPRCSFGRVVVDLNRREVHRDEKAIELSAREFRLLEFFLEHEGEVLPRDKLLDAVWDYDDPPLTRTVDMHVAKLRKKLEEDPADPRHIITVHRQGYKFVRER